MLNQIKVPPQQSGTRGRELGKRLALTLLVVWVFGLSTGIYLGKSLEGKEELIGDREHLGIVKSMISSSEKRIWIAVAWWKYDPDDPDDPANDDILSLIEAKKRGVDVRVIIRDPEKDEMNRPAVELLLREGIEVRFAEELHSKIYLVDEKVLVTSMNETESAQKYNLEAGILTDDPSVVKEAERLFLKYWEISSEPDSQ
ncbi:MAG TPA: hypothetical protein ENF65_00110 [Euryarchaeota archaeon]|nr:MAG: hypothetical protein DRN46_04325 [Thermococci archaeon]RLF93339.1 MAG: hypothetical protein DRN52_06640 [Thermococci archaeon]HDI10133.1 hypothetical protein [Euryarchaeota archaeon]